MGHKTHPNGFRLGITADHKSTWYANQNGYSQYIQQDFLIRNAIHEFLDKQAIKIKGIVNILISRNEQKKQINIDIHTACPGLIVGQSGSTLEQIDKNLSQLVPDYTIRINITAISEAYEHAELLAETLMEQLETRVPFRRAMKNIAERSKAANSQGIKIQVGGRLNGAEIARTEWLREGRVPLQTLRANIDYSYRTAKTIYGILGIKIWLFKGEILTK
jgi:small subunit ribosomal protein S3